MKNITITLLLSLLINLGYSQESESSFSLEIGGSGGLGSINYEKFFTQKENTKFLWRVGLSGVPIDKNSGVVFIIPVSFGGLVGSEKHFLDWGIGLGNSFTTKGGLFTRAIPSIGYRLAPIDKRIYVALKYTPLISFLVDFQFEQWGGITIGCRL